MRTPYEVLGVPEDASLPAIQAAYRAAAKRYHPDSGGQKNAALFDEATQARDALIDEDTRARLDRLLAAERDRLRAQRPQANDQRPSDETCGDRDANTSANSSANEQPWWIDDYPGRGGVPWRAPGEPIFTGPNHVVEPSVYRPAGASGAGTERRPQESRAVERFPLLGRFERRNLAPSFLAGLVVASGYALLSLIRFDPHMALAARKAASGVGPIHIAVAFAAATLIAWSALGVRPYQRLAVISSTALVVGGASALTVVRNAWMWGVIALVAFLAAASRSRPQAASVKRRGTTGPS